MAAQGGRVVRLVPRDVEGHAGRGSRKPMHRRDILHLLPHVAGLAGAGEAPEAGSARTEGPRGNRDLEACDPGDGGFEVEPTPGEQVGEVGQVALVRGGGCGARTRGLGKTIRHLGAAFRASNQGHWRTRRPLRPP